ncbi:hypothetical protein MTO96_044714 [Rhipicephalus appendiculatus]
MAGCSYKNVLCDSDDDSDGDSVISWASATVGVRNPHHHQPALKAFRRVCQCRKETTTRAFYLRRAKRPRPLQRWRAKYPWVAKIFSAVVRGSDPDPRYFLRALWAYTLFGARQRLTAAATELAATLSVPSCHRRELQPLLEFTSCASMCGNVRHAKPAAEWSCVRLEDLAADCSVLRVLPFQLVVVVVDCTDALMALRIPAATLRHLWTQVRKVS